MATELLLLMLAGFDQFNYSLKDLIQKVTSFYSAISYSLYEITRNLPQGIAFFS